MSFRESQRAGFVWRWTLPSRAVNVTLCLQGHPNLCEQVIFAGHGTYDGALREFMPWDQKCLFPIPDSMTDEDGAMLEPLGVAIHAVDLGHLKVGMTVGVFGCGPIGLSIVQLARLSGVREIIATDLLDHRVSAAKSLGADQAFRVKGRLDVEIHSRSDRWSRRGCCLRSRR